MIFGSRQKPKSKTCSYVASCKDSNPLYKVDTINLLYIFENFPHEISNRLIYWQVRLESGSVPHTNIS